MSSNEWEQGLAYVKKLREDLHTDDEIRQIMLEVGWEEEQIEQLVTRKRPAAGPATAAPASRPEPSWASATPSRPGARRSTALVSRPVGMTILVVLADIGALINIIASGVAVVGVLVMGGLRYLGEASGMGVLIVALLFVGILINLGILVVGHFLWNGFNWARVTFMVLLGLSALQCFLGLLLSIGYASGGGIESVVVLVLEMAVCGLFIFILKGRGAREYCTR